MRSLMALIVLVPVLSLGQSRKAAAPSKEEISDLLAKAEEKVSSFEEAVKHVKPALESGQTDLLSKDTTAAENAHRIIRALDRNGASAYALVALISVLDEISLNASKSATFVILTGTGKIDTETQGKLTLLWNAQNSCSDISDLILHATLRLIQAEESMLDGLTAEKN